eukprot:1086930-Pelagomonas_calceolata.AAC.4
MERLPVLTILAASRSHCEAQGRTFSPAHQVEASCIHGRPGLVHTTHLAFKAVRRPLVGFPASTWACMAQTKVNVVLAYSHASMSPCACSLPIQEDFTGSRSEGAGAV